MIAQVGRRTILNTPEIQMPHPCGAFHPLLAFPTGHSSPFFHSIRGLFPLARHHSKRRSLLIFKLLIFNLFEFFFAFDIIHPAGRV